MSGRRFEMLWLGTNRLVMAVFSLLDFGLALVFYHRSQIDFTVAFFLLYSSSSWLRGRFFTLQHSTTSARSRLVGLCLEEEEGFCTVLAVLSEVNDGRFVRERRVRGLSHPRWSPDRFAKGVAQC